MPIPLPFGPQQESDFSYKIGYAIGYVGAWLRGLPRKLLRRALARAQTTAERVSWWCWAWRVRLDGTTPLQALYEAERVQAAAATARQAATEVARLNQSGAEIDEFLLPPSTN